jgi:signal transduction histidine kinase
VEHSPQRLTRWRSAVDRLRSRRTSRELPLGGATLALPAALLLLLALSSFTLVSYRNAIELLVEERREEALRLARGVAAQLPGQGVPTPAALRQLAPQANRILVADSRGQVLAASGEPLLGTFLAPLEGGRPRETAVGPNPAAPASVVAFQVLRPEPELRLLRLDLRAPTLDRQRASLGVLTWVVLGSNVAVVAWLVLFLHGLLGPYQKLLSRARELRPPEVAGGEDDSSFLLRTLEQALANNADGGELQVLEETLGRSLESGLLLLDRHGRVLALNGVGRELLGVASPAPHTPVTELLPTHLELLELLESSLGSQRAVQRREISLEHAEGARTLGLSATPLQRADGEPLGLLVLFTDLTEVERREQEVRLAESLAQLGELAAGVAHELRNGLATVNGYVELLDRAADREQAGELLEELRRETRQLQRVVTDFLTFTRPGSAGLSAVDLGQLARRALADPALASVGRAGEASEEPAWLAAGDAQLLERALRNLLYNAVEAEREAGRRENAVCLETGWREGGYELAVCDRGPGLPGSVRERLFQPFITTRSGGVGLGLALAHRIVTLHGGSLRLEDRPGGGTCARVRFPAAALAVPPPEP